MTPFRARILMNVSVAAGLILLHLSLHRDIGGMPAIVAAMVLFVTAVACLLWAHPRAK